MKKGAGFTLIELVMVIVILAIISSLAVSRFGAMRNDAARKVSIANQLAVERGVETFLAMNGGTGLNRLDSLIDANTPHSAGNAGFDFDSLSSDSSVGGLYRGPVDLGGLTREAVREENAGLDENLVDLLCLYRVDAEEVKALHRIGLDFVMRHNTFATGRAYDHYGRGDDGTVPQGEGALDPQESACIAEGITNGMVFAAVNPRLSEGRKIFQACGQALLQTREPEEIYPEEEVREEVKATGGPLIVLGLGAECTLIGQARGGLESAPYSEVLSSEWYRSYLLLLRLRRDAASNRVTVEFAGVLDPEGRTVRSARNIVK